MGKLQNLHLVLSRPEEDAVYEPGDHVDGYVIVEVKDTMKVKDLVVEFVGQAGVQWNESVSGSADKHRRVNMRHYSATEKYFSFHQQLLGADSDSISGRMSLPFRFRLPHNIPSSFTSAVGHVKYVLSVRLSRSWGSDRHDNLAVCVRRPLSLDQEADFLLCVNPSGISFTLVVPLPVVLGDVPLSAKYIDLLRQHKDRTVGRHGNGRGSRDENRRHVDETRSPNAEDGKFLRTVNAVHPGVERMMTQKNGKHS
nr:hypothetical protein BaRGS_012350 [Batillaria attramentaria]